MRPPLLIQLIFKRKSFPPKQILLGRGAKRKFVSFTSKWYICYLHTSALSSCIMQSQSTPNTRYLLTLITLCCTDSQCFCHGLPLVVYFKVDFSLFIKRLDVNKRDKEKHITHCLKITKNVSYPKQLIFFQIIWNFMSNCHFGHFL